MRNNLKILGACIVLIFLAATTCLASDIKYSGFLEDLYKNLQAGPKDGAKMRWIKPGVNFTKYNSLMN